MDSASPLLEYNVDGFFSEMQARLDVQRAYLAEIQDRSHEVLAAEDDSSLGAAPSLPKAAAPGHSFNRATHSDAGSARAMSPLAASFRSVVSDAGSMTADTVTGAQLLQRFSYTLNSRVPSHAVAAYEDVSVKICGLIDEFLRS